MQAHQKFPCVLHLAVVFALSSLMGIAPELIQVMAKVLCR